MGKWVGVIGYAIDNNDGHGIHVEEIIERHCVGDLLRNTRKLQSADKVNDDVAISNQISIIADPFAYANFCNIRYITYLGSKWKVSSVDVQYPRLILDIGGLYNA